METMSIVIKENVREKTPEILLEESRDLQSHPEILEAMRVFGEEIN